jgi:hypothetical protein
MTADDFAICQIRRRRAAAIIRKRRHFQRESGLSATTCQVQSLPLFKEQIRLEMEDRQ